MESILTFLPPPPPHRVALFRTEDKCFVTFDSDNLNIPLNVRGIPGANTTAYNIFYTPDTDDGE